MVNYTPGFRCPYCLNEYKTDDEAEDCAHECVRVEEILNVSVATCELCGEIFSTEINAEKCEAYHKEVDDNYYKAWQSKENFRILEEAAKKPGQKKLEE